MTRRRRVWINLFLLQYVIVVVGLLVGSSPTPLWWILVGPAITGVVFATIGVNMVGATGRGSRSRQPGTQPITAPRARR